MSRRSTRKAGYIDEHSSGHRGFGVCGSHVILLLLNSGYVVRTIVRSLKREESVRAMLSDAGAGAGDRSKAIAERAAWDFMVAEGGALELSVVNPSGIFGPVLGLGDAAKKVPTRQLPNWLVRFVALFDPTMLQIANYHFL